MDDFVTPASIRIPLSGGQFIDIKKRLTHGDTEDMYERISPYGLGVKRREVRTAKIAAYLLGWSLTKNGAPVPMSQELPEQTRIDTIRGLDQDRALEIFKAIEAHETAMDQERADQKKILNEAPSVAAISSLPSDVVGAPTGSVN